MSLAELAERPGVQRLAVDHFTAKYRFHADDSGLTALMLVEEWADDLGAETLEQHFLADSLATEEFEGLLDFVLRRERPA